MQVLIQTILSLSVVFIPLTFTTLNSELFEFPKFILLLSASLLLLVAWVIDSFQQKKSFLPLSLLRHPLSFTVLSILLTQLLSTLFSINPYTSFWGYYSRFHQGLLTTICYTIIYFTAALYLDKTSIQKLIKVSIGTAFIISLYAILQRLGIDKSLWIQDVVNRPFSTLGQPNWLAAYLLPSLFLTLYFFRLRHQSVTYALATLVLYLALLFTKSRSGFLAFALSYPLYYFLLARQFTFAKIKRELAQTALIFLLLSLLAGTPFTPKLSDLLRPNITPQPTTLPAGTQLENGGTESGDIRRIVWTGALELIKKHPLVGTGPETFAYTYYWARPLAHNQTSEWDFLYNKAHNEYLNFAATSGLLGLLAYLSFHFVIFRTSLTLLPRTKKVDQSAEDQLRHLYPVLGASIASFGITNFFGFSVIPVYLLITLIASFPLALPNKPGHSSPPSPTLLALPFLTFLYPLHLFLADVAYAKGKALLDTAQPAAALPLLQSAVAKRPGLDLYHSTLGEAYAQLGDTSHALQEAETTRAQNPYHLNFHKSRAKIYLTLAQQDTTLYSRSASELQDARLLAPTDPKLAYNLGLIYTRLGDNTKAAEELRTALTLKPDYESPYYALTLLYEQTDQKDKIPDLLKDAKDHLATYSSALRVKILNY